MTSEEKTKELISQFGDNAKYVVLEVKEELKQLYKDLGLEHEEQKNYMIRVLNYWSRVKEAIEKKNRNMSKLIFQKTIHLRTNADSFHSEP